MEPVKAKKEIMEPQQSPLYAQYMKRLKWDVVIVDGANVFLKRFPLMGAMAKIHRPEKLPSPTKLIPVLKTYHVRRLVLEPTATENQSHIASWIKSFPAWVTLRGSTFLPTKTIHVDLTTDVEKIFASLTEAKRRAVRRATKLGIKVEEASGIDALIHVKNSAAGLFGFITTTGIRELWETFSPKHAAILLAYADNSTKPIGGVLLIFWDHVAYYWIAGTTKQGKKLFAPTLLAWEAIRLAKKRGAHTFDFVGVWDERLPKENLSWKGFTKFKEGFSDQTVYYPLINRL